MYSPPFRLGFQLKSVLLPKKIPPRPVIDPAIYKSRVVNGKEGVLECCGRNIPMSK
jgi:hypothetical protein